MSYRRTPSGDPIPDHIPASLETEFPRFDWWLIGCLVSLVIWGVGLWLIWSHSSSLRSFL